MSFSGTRLSFGMLIDGGMLKRDLGAGDGVTRVARRL